MILGLQKPEGRSFQNADVILDVLFFWMKHFHRFISALVLGPLWLLLINACNRPLHK